MQSRMDRYDLSEKKKYERSRKNTKLYEDIYDDMYKDISYKNMEIIDSAKEININKLKDILDDKYDTRQYRTFKNYDTEEEVEDIKINKTKIYDINEIINDAKSKRAFIEEAKEKQKYIDFTSSRKKEIEDLKNEEKELEDLINTVTIKKNEDSTELDLLSELKGDDDTIVTKPVSEYDESKKKTEIEEEDQVESLAKTLVKADKTFYTDSNMFTKNDFEDFSTLQDEINYKTHKKRNTIIFLLIIVLLIVGYFVYIKYFMK